MSHAANPAQFLFSDIEAATRQHFGIDRAQLVGRSREQRFCRARYCAVYLARLFTPLSLPAIGNYLHRDHTSILNAARRAESLIATDEKFRGDMAAVLEKLCALPIVGRQRLAYCFVMVPDDPPKPFPRSIAETWV